MSQKKQKLLRKYLTKRNANNKVYITGNKRHPISKEIKGKYTSANSNDKRVLTKFFKEIVK